VIGVLTLSTAAYTYRIFIDPSPIKRDLAGLLPVRPAVPCGVNWAHQIGLKTAAFIIRQQSDANDGLVADVGESPDIYLLGRHDKRASFRTIVRALAADPDANVHDQFGVRFLAISPLLQIDHAAIEIVNRRSPPFLNVVRSDGTSSLLVWDLVATEHRQPKTIRVAEYDAAFQQEFGSVFKRFSAWRRRSSGAAVRVRSPQV
jgi:hypothetical protein